MTPTNEQRAIVKWPIHPGYVLLVQAFAGAGKTSTGKMYAEAYPQQRFLYAAFNKAAQIEASAKMPSNVTCKTTHAIAYADSGVMYQHKLGEPKPKDIMGPLCIKQPMNAVAVIGTLNNFLHSPDKNVGLAHVPDEHRKKPLPWAEAIVSAAKKLWSLMQNVDSPIAMSHDGYLKLWQIKCIDRVPAFFDQFDTIILDEAQDTNPAMEYVMDRLVSSGRHGLILFGDERQSINQWRGAVNMMGRMKESISAGNMRGEHKSLTESFRFGPEIAEIATIVLNIHSAEPVAVTGCGKPGRGRPTSAVLARTNGALIAHAIAQIEEDPKTKLHFAGTDERSRWSPVVPYKFEFIRSVYALSVGLREQIKDSYVIQFESFSEAKEHAKGGDVELGQAVRAVEKYGSDLPYLLDDIVSRCGPPEGAQCYSTAHRSKGLEWDDVVLLDDFPKFSEAEGKKDSLGTTVLPPEAEGNLAYVAVTRARRHLTLNKDLGLMMQELQEKQANHPAEEEAEITV